MAAKVNVKFVVMLGAALTLVLAGMAAVFFFVLKKSGQDWADRGAEAMAAQDYETADTSYAFAVAHDRTNVEWLGKWIDAMEHRVIDNEVDFEDRFRKDYTNAIRQVAHMGRTADLGAHLRYLDMMSEQMLGQTRSDAWRYLLNEARASQQFYEAGGMAPVPGQGTPEPWHVLYKYSGLALSVLYSLNMTENDDEVAMAERDLRLALEADPSDAEAALELAQFYSVMSDRRRTSPPIDLAEAERLLRQARELLVAMAERNPNDPDVAIGLLQMDVNAARREFISRLAGRPATPEQIREVTAPFEARLDAVANLLMERAATGLENVTLGRFAALESLAAPDSQRNRTARVLNAILAADSENLQAMIMLAEVQGSGQNRAEGVATLQRLIDLPNKPLGIAGYRLFRLRPAARELQAEFTLDQFDEAPEADRPALLAQAEVYREALSKEVPADSPSLLKLDARMAFLRQDWARAEELLLAVNQRTGGSDNDVLWWMAQTAQRLQKLGVARQMLNTLHEQSPDNPRILMALAAVERDLRNEDRARALAARLQQLRPNDPQIAEFVAMINGQGDAIQEAMERYVTILEGGGPDGALPNAEAAIARLNEDFQANNFHPALGLQLVRGYLDRGDIDSTKAVVDAVLSVHPDDAGFRRFRSSLERGDIVAVLIDLINTGEGRSDFEKAMLRRLLYITRGDQANADRELAAAALIEPNNRTLVEAQFLEAISANDGATVTRLAARAKELNLDDQNGDTFLVRAMMFEGKHREAVALLESLVTRSPNDGSLWRLLGLERAQVGRLDEAVTAYRRTLEIRPNDTQAAKELMGLLSARGNNAAALQVAQETEPFGRGDLDFLNRLWILEALSGNRQVALEQREALRARDPALVWNNALLAELYMDVGRWPDARALIDEMRAGEDRLELVSLDARWHADQGDFEALRQAYIKYIGSLPAGQVGSEPFIAMASFMQSREQLGLAAAALEGGRIEQDRATMDCDRMLGDILTVAQRLPEAVEAYKRVVDANADTTDFMFRKRMVENLIRLERFDEAEANLAAMRDIATTDRNVMLLNAELNRTRGNRTEALRLLDEAVRLFPDDPVAYFQRAEVLQEDEARWQDAVADYDSAIRKSNQFWQALRNRSGVYRRMGRIDEAVADLRAGVLAAGTEGDAVTQLLGELMNLRRTQDATSAADEAVAARPTDAAFIQRVGSIFAGRGEWTVAARYYKMAFDLRQEPDIAQRYLDCLLNQNPAQVRTAEDVLNVLGQKILEHPGLLAAGVSIHVRRARVGEAERDATRAFDLVSTDTDRLLVWHRTMQRAFADPVAYQAYLRRLAAAKQTTALRDWPVLFLASSQATVEGTREAAKEQLVRLANQGQPIEVRQNAMRTIGTTLYEQGLHEEAARLWSQAVEMFPQDWEVNNNLAYVLTEYLGRAEEALPHALKAVEFQPRSPSVNDTVGWVYFKTGDADKALLYLWQAARLSRDAAEQSVTVRHIIEVELSRGEKANAERWYSYLDRLITESPWLDPDIRTQAEALKARINSLP